MTDEFDLKPGTVIAGRFEIYKTLGSGSMGMVYECKDREFPDRLVAVKVLFPDVAADDVQSARFRNEIISSYRVSHPNVIRSFELVRDSDLIGFTMEYIDGGTLLEYINPNNLLPVSEAIALIVQMCSGVQAIHDAGIVHRDLKPENILLTDERNVKIADFGIARTTHGPKLTEHGGVVGTIDYVAPEYILESKVDWRSDIYALGILSYELLTGQAAFEGDSVYSIMTQRLNQDPVPPSQLRPECPPEVDRVIMKAIARNAEDRYQTAAEYAVELAAIDLGIEEETVKKIEPQIKAAKVKQQYWGPELDPETVESLPQSVISKARETVELDTLKDHQGKEVPIEEVRKDDSFKTPERNDTDEYSIRFDSEPEQKEPAKETSKTATIEPEIIDIASYYQIDQSSKLESVLGRAPMQSRAEHDSEPTVLVNTTSIDKLRSEAASAGVRQQRASFSYNKLLLSLLIFFAVLLGAFGGFYLAELIFNESNLF